VGVERLSEGFMGCTGCGPIKGIILLFIILSLDYSQNLYQVSIYFFNSDLINFEFFV
jgi:hypothetical protein